MFAVLIVAFVGAIVALTVWIVAFAGRNVAFSRIFPKKKAFRWGAASLGDLLSLLSFLFCYCS